MSTAILDHQDIEELQPAYALWKQYMPERAPYRFQAETVAQAKQWQNVTRRALAEVAGGPAAGRGHESAHRGFGDRFVSDRSLDEVMVDFFAARLAQ